jgi:hypothetical protein
VFSGLLDHQKHIGHVLNFLRDPVSFKLSDITQAQRLEVEVEVRFYGARWSPLEATKVTESERRSLLIGRAQLFFW